MPTTVLAVCTIALAIARPSTLAAPQQEQSVPRKPKIVVLTFSGGFRHDVLGLAEQTIAKLAKTSGAFEADVLGLYRQDSAKLDLSLIDAAFLEKYDGFVFYTTSGERDKDLLTEAQRSALLDAIKGGKAFIGIHSAADTFYQWPEYGEMIGAYFDGHPWGADAAPVTLKIEDRGHPACRDLGTSWFLQEEIYQFRAPYDRKKLHLLMSLDTDATDTSVPGINRKDGDFAVAWTKRYGKGRVFYTALGHRAEVWRDELFQKHLLGGIRWALGQQPGKPFLEGDRVAGTVTLESGLQYIDLKVGTGPAAHHRHTLIVHYIGRLADGTTFDNSRKREAPLRFMLGIGKVIRGWDEGLEGMKVGGTRKLIIPPHLGYGEKGMGDAIPPNATLVFEIELLDARN